MLFENTLLVAVTGPNYTKTFFTSNIFFIASSMVYDTFLQKYVIYCYSLYLIKCFLQMSYLDIKLAKDVIKLSLLEKTTAIYMSL